MLAHGRRMFDALGNGVSSGSGETKTGAAMKKKRIAYFCSQTGSNPLPMVDMTTPKPLNHASM